MQLLTIDGNIGKDGVIKQVRGGDVLSFPVGVKQGSGDNVKTNWYRVQVWGKLAQIYLPKAVKGVRIFAQGKLKIDEYQGKPSFDLDVSEIRFVNAPKAESRPAAPVYQDDSFLDDTDVPF